MDLRIANRLVILQQGLVLNLQLKSFAVRKEAFLGTFPKGFCDLPDVGQVPGKVPRNPKVPGKVSGLYDPGKPFRKPF